MDIARRQGGAWRAGMFAAAGWLGLCLEAQAQTPPVDAEEAVVPYPDLDADAPYLDLLDGTLGVKGDLREDTAVPTGWLRRPTAMQSWFAWKGGVRERTGFSFGGSWMLLGQSYSSSLIDEDTSVGSKVTLNFSLDLFNRNEPNALALDMAVEDRRPVGTDLAPLFAGFAAGSLIPTAATYGDFSLGVTQLYLRQNLFNNKFQYTVGKIFAPNFIDAYPFFDDNRQFLSQAFSTSPSIASPLRGFGAVAAWYPGTSGLYVKPGIFTTHSDDTGSTIDDFFNTSEHFYMLEVGWSGLARTGTPIQARAAMDANNFHLTGWYKDAEENGPPRAYGVAMNANYMYGPNLMWFVRAGWSEGWQVDRSAAVGIGWRPTEHFSDLFGIAIGANEPASDFLRNQYTAEVFYRFHVTPNFAITPDLQLQHKPSRDPSEDSLWVFSLRGRITF